MADDRDIEDVDSRDDSPTYGTGERKSADQEHQQALERLQLSAEAYNRQNERERAALAFQVPELQWKNADRDARKGDVIDDITIPDRPTIAIPKIDQSIQLVLNSERSAHLGVKVEPLDERGTDETAEIQTGLYRQIERESRAGLARSWAFERGVKAGRGAWRVITKPAANYKQTKDQDLRIKRILYQESVYLDPFATEPDWSDGEWGLILEWVSFSKYKRLYKTVKQRPGEDDSSEPDDLPSILAGMSDGELVRLQETCPDWVRGDGEGRAVLIGEYMFMESRPDDEAEATAQKWRGGEDRRVCWRQMNAVEFMDYGYIHSAFIPIIPAIGRELIPFDGERRWMGMYEPNADAQRFFNYSASKVVEIMASEGLSDWVLAEGQEEGHEREWLLANIKNFPYKRYKPKTVGSELVTPPYRAQSDTSKFQTALQALQIAGEFVHAGTATFEPSLGQNSPNVKTKGGTLALQAQSEQANSHWLDNQAELSMTLEAKIILSMLPFYYDRPGRVARILGVEEKDSKAVILNAPFVMQGKRPRPLPYATPDEKTAADAQVADPNNPAQRYDLMAGRYGAVVSIGKGYKSRIDQGADELGQLFQAEPQLFALLGDIYLRFRDFPGHTEAADRIKKMLPAQLQDKDAQDDPKLQLEQAKAQMQQMQQQLQEMGKALETDKVKADASIEQKRIDAKAKYAIALLDTHIAELKLKYDLEIARINNLTKIDVADIASNTTLTTAAGGHAHEQHENERDRQAEIALAAAGRAAGIEDQALAHASTLDQADQSQQHGLEAGQASADQQAELAGQGHEQNLEAQQQAAELAPEPAEGGA